MSAKLIPVTRPDEVLSYLRRRGINIEGGEVVLNKARNAIGLISPVEGQKGCLTSHTLPHTISTEKYIIALTASSDVHANASNVFLPTLIIPGEKNSLTLQFKALNEEFYSEVPVWLVILDSGK